LNYHLSQMVNYLPDSMVALCMIYYLSDSKGHRLFLYSLEAHIVSKLKPDYIFIYIH
jgi:hypothetical protein